MSDQRKRAGRPKKQGAAGTTVALGLRVPAELKARLDSAADIAGRSQGEEAARRLAASFELQPIAEIMGISESTGDGRWFEDPAKAAMVFRLVGAYLRSLLSDRCKDIVNFEEAFGSDPRADVVFEKMFPELRAKGE